jgi:hypothetical protein
MKLIASHWITYRRIERRILREPSLLPEHAGIEMRDGGRRLRTRPQSFYSSKQVGPREGRCTAFVRSAYLWACGVLLQASSRREQIRIPARLSGVQQTEVLNERRNLSQVRNHFPWNINKQCLKYIHESTLAGFTFVGCTFLHVALVMLATRVARWFIVWVATGPRVMLRDFWGTLALTWGTIRRRTCSPCFVVVLFGKRKKWSRKNNIPTLFSTQPDRR